MLNCLYLMQKAHGHMHMVRVCMRLCLIGTAVSVKEKQETTTNSRLD